MSTSLAGWRGVKAEVSRRIHAREWPAGHVIPAETALAAEFGCARATVNRALRELAEAGVLRRRRRAGTVVAENPVRKASFDIPVIRLEVEQRGERYTHRLLTRQLSKPPAAIRAMFDQNATDKALKLVALHLADDRPYVWESRWVNLDAVPAASEVDFKQISANEWLVRHAPFSSGRYTVAASLADSTLSGALNCKAGEPLLSIERNTLDAQQRGITVVQLIYAPGHRLRGEI